MATTTTETVRLTIDGIPISVPKGTLVIEAARRVGVMIPHFCYHPKLKPDANCRMCLVEVERMPKLQTSCSTVATEGMAVHTATTVVHDAHKSVLEFILANHPYDTPEFIVLPLTAGNARYLSWIDASTSTKSGSKVRKVSKSLKAGADATRD